MIDVLFLEGLQGDLRFPQDLVLPRQQLRAKVIALAVVHERLFFGRSIVLQLFQGQPIFTCKAGRKSIRPRGPYIAAGCDRQNRPSPKGARPPSLAQAIAGASRFYNPPRNTAGYGPGGRSRRGEELRNPPRK